MTDAAKHLASSCGDERLDYSTSGMPLLVIVLLSLAVLVGFRVWVLASYCFQYLEEDQAVMWLGATEMSAGRFHEPCFYGQSYGSMFEALAAVPLLWIGLPHEIALPVAATVVNTAPYVVTLVFIYRHSSTRMPVLVILALLVLICMSWRWDVMTSIPRSFAPGVAVSMIGVVVFLESEGRWGALISALLLVMGVVMTATAVSVVCVLTLYQLLRLRGLRHTTWPWAIGGATLGFALGGAKEYFYRSNPTYALHGAPSLSFSVATLMSNLCDGGVFADFSFLGQGLSFIALLAAPLIIAAVKGDKKMTVVCIASYLGILLSLGMGKLNDYAVGSVLFSRSRMLLWVPAVLFELVYLLSIDCDEGVYGNRNKTIRPVSYRVCAVMAIALCLSTIMKVQDYSSALSNQASGLYQVGPLTVTRVSDAYEWAGRIRNAYDQSGSDVVVVVGSRVLGYTFSALEEGVPEYNAEYDRRTWVWEDMSSRDRTRILYAALNSNEIEFSTRDTGPQTVTECVFEDFGLQRVPV